MPAIKLKKVTAEYMAEKEKENEKLKEAQQQKKQEEVEDQPDEAEEEEEEKPHNFLEVQVLSEKRKRTIPVDEQKLQDWLESNLEKREDVHLPNQQLYEFYCVMCQAQGQDAKVVDILVFNRYIREKFGKYYGFQENSPYKVLLKERKTKVKKVKVPGEVQPIKFRDIVTEVINDAGNPRLGVRFFHISKAIMKKYPSQRVDIYPKKLKWALERGVAVGYLERLRGVGMCGLYRVTGEPTKAELEREKKKTAKQDKEGSDEGKVNVEKEELEGGEADSEEKTEAEKTENSEEEETENGESAKKSEEDHNSGDTEPKRQRPKKKKKASKTVEISAARHSDPRSIEDALPMAITYQSEPKAVSGIRIKKYIDRFYHTDLNPERLKKALDTGVDRGLWEKLRGTGIAGIYHLLTETFMPSESEDLYDQICQAIVAYNEPKQASSLLIKKYINQYHPGLNIENRPKEYRKCLQRAIDKRIIRQLSGIGASGTFQLIQQFIPSPAILAGESEDEDEENEKVVHQDSDYIPRKTKHGRLAIRTNSQSSVTSSARSSKATKPSTPKSKKGKPSSRPRTAHKAKRIADSSDEEEEEEEEVKPRKAAPAKSKKAGAKKPAKNSESQNTTPEKSAATKKPKSKTKSAGRNRSDVKPTAPSATPARLASSRRAGRVSYVEESEEEEDEVPVVKSDKKVKGKPESMHTKESSSPSKARKRGRVNYSEESGGEEEEEEQTEAEVKVEVKAPGNKRVQPKAMTGPAESGEEEEEEAEVEVKASGNKRVRPKAVAGPAEMGEEDEQAEEKALGNKRSRGKPVSSPAESGGRRRGSKVNYSEQSDGDDEEELVAPAKKSTNTPKKSEGRKPAKRMVNEDLSEGEEEEIVAPAKKVTSTPPTPPKAEGRKSAKRKVDEELSEEEEEPVVPAKKATNTPPKAEGRKSAKRKLDEDLDKDEDVPPKTEEAQPSPAKKKAGGEIPSSPAKPSLEAKGKSKHKR